MVSVAVKSLWARKLRALGTTVAVFVGVSLIAGTYVITDTINRAFDQIFTDSLKGTSVVITNKQPVTQQTNTSTSFPAGVLKKVQAVPGVKLAAGTIFTRRRHPQGRPGGGLAVRAQVHLRGAAAADRDAEDGRGPPPGQLPRGHARQGSRRRRRPLDR